MTPPLDGGTHRFGSGLGPSAPSYPTFASDVPVKLPATLALSDSAAVSAMGMFAPPRGSMIYQTYQAQTDLLWALRVAAKSALPALHRARGIPGEDMALRKLAAAFEVFVLATLTHQRPPFRIDSVSVGAKEVEVEVEEEEAFATPFGTLLHLRKAMPDPGPRVLIVAPMSGHFATLLRDTVRTMLADHDVYITDWRNARDVPLWHGRFGMDEYISHLIDFLGTIGPGVHAVAVCQPCVALLAAAALM